MKLFLFYKQLYINLAGDAGLEPTHVAVKVLCLTDLANPLYKVVEDGGFEPPKAMLTDLQSAPFGRSGNPPRWSW